MKLVIAEKPSVAMALASVLGARTRKDGYVEGNGYIVSWCVGHLVGLCDASEYDEKYKKWRYEDLPIVPECWKHRVLEGTKKQFGILKKLMRDSKVDEVICATDAGREGELIFRLVYEQAGCKKPMKRLWISSMEEQAIKDGFASLKDGSCYDSLYQSALCRAKADWLVGINASRLFSVLYNQNLKVGRVQTPTLAMIVDRNQKIKEFTKEKYYMAHIKFDDMDAVTEHFQKKEDADRVAADCMERMCEVEKDDVKEKTVRPPKLYDLTTLQREANRMFGYTAQQTLDAVQEMYEQKLVTYPRTDSQYLTDEMGESTETLIQMLLGKMPYASVDNMLKITNDGRKLALDQRLVNELLPDNPESKIAVCAEKSYEIWKDTAAQKSAQLIFCDLSTPKGDGSFNVYDDLKQKLMEKGVPEKEIAFIHDANTEVKKTELFGKVKSGQVRFLIGSTAKMGAGTNVQDRLIALHHLDIGWKPSDLERAPVKAS